ncbi:MAG: hypothetical protein II393_04190 [Cytophagales bacterium]|nr:hypothetical protein [Cytophagales bacterium]
MTYEELYLICKEQIRNGNGNEKANIVDKYIMSEEEYNAIDFYLDYSKLLDSGLYVQQNEAWGDYFIDLEENTAYYLNEGLEVIQETILDLEDYRDNGYPEELLKGLYNLYKNRLGVELWEGFDENE